MNPCTLPTYASQQSELIPHHHHHNDTKLTGSHHSNAKCTPDNDCTEANLGWFAILCSTCLICVGLLVLPGFHTKADRSRCGLGLSAPLPLPEYGMGDGIGMATEYKSKREEWSCQEWKATQGGSAVSIAGRRPTASNQLNACAFTSWLHEHWEGRGRESLLGCSVEVGAVWTGAPTRRKRHGWMTRCQSDKALTLRTEQQGTDTDNRVTRDWHWYWQQSDKGVTLRTE